MNNKYISDKEFASLSEAEQLQYCKDLVKDIPHEDMVMLKKVLPEISKIQQSFKNERY